MKKNDGLPELIPPLTPEVQKAVDRFQKLPGRMKSSKAIYMVWVRKERSSLGAEIENVDLRSVCRSKELAALHAEVIKRDEPDVTGVWVEERVDNHVYGQRDVRLAFRLLGVENKWVRE